MYQVVIKDLEIKYNGPYPLPREQWEEVEKPLSVGFLTRREADQWLERYQVGYVELYKREAYIIEIPGEPKVQEFSCENCGQPLPHYIEVIAHNGELFYGCPRCGLVR